MQSAGEELPAVSCVGYNKKGETIFLAGTSNSESKKPEAFFAYAGFRKEKRKQE